MFKIGSHDTMTYLPVKNWLLKPFKFLAQCQSKTIEEQFEDYNIRYFDLRVHFDNHGNPEFRHGLMTFKGDVFKILEYLNSKNEEVWIRILLEGTESGFKLKYPFSKNKQEIEKERQIMFFRMFMAKVEEKYTNLKFHNGRSKWDWKIVYICKYSEPTIDQKVSSMTWKIWDDWCPYIYARVMNKYNIEAGTDKEYLLLDFLHIR